MTQTAAPIEADEEPVLAVSEATEEVVDRMLGLDLWETRVDAGLFLVGLAVAHDEEPLGADERGEPTAELGPVDDSQAEDREQLAIVEVLADDEPLTEALSAWAEAGAELLGPELAGADAVEATAAIVEISREVS
ncbi:hypothetical protein BRD56_07330 [Thermoplasmatales archaeon SW_10_69_26]|nr:MAG: hypothetical protein BRD56_07330 [Thermoplasmatales archaeon SW_10_69_26]